MVNSFKLEVLIIRKRGKGVNVSLKPPVASKLFKVVVAVDPCVSFVTGRQWLVNVLVNVPKVFNYLVLDTLFHFFRLCSFFSSKRILSENNSIAYQLY